MFKNCLILLFFLKIIFLTSFHVNGADMNNRFAASGAGVATCSRFVEARTAKSEEYFLFGGWVDGYFSARNQFEKETYTLLPWQSIDVLSGFLTDYCNKNPQHAFQRAVMVMAQALIPDRLTKSSKRIAVAVGPYKSDFFVEVLIRLQKKLTALGFYHGTQNGQYDDDTASALRYFQKKNAIAVTGFPDQLTLYRLFLHD